MTMGLTIVPATFQHFMTDIFQDLSVFVVVYLDDILIYSELEKVHRDHVRHALMHFCEHNLHDKPGITVKQIQSAIGFANFYHCFIIDFSGMIAPLNHLTHKDAKFSWGPEQQQAFETLKLAFTLALVLTHFDPAHPIIIRTDASDYAMAAIISQVSPDDGNLHPNAFYSRGMKPPESNYKIYDKKLLSIFETLGQWRNHLKGSTHTILVLSDHNNPEYFATTKQLTCQQV